MRETVHVAMKGNPYVMGIVPQMLSPYDPRPVVEQLNEGYAHGGGWLDFKGFTVVENEDRYELAYPGEPDVGIMTSYVEIEGVYFYRHRKRKKPSVVTYPVPDRLLKRIEEVEDLPGLVEQALSG